MPRTLLLLALLSAGCSDAPSTDQSATAPASDTTATRDTLIHPDERHFKTLKQLTFGGDNAEALTKAVIPARHVLSVARTESMCGPFTPASTSMSAT
jgi:hypothetical protein